MLKNYRATFVGNRPLLFDRYAGDNNTKTTPEQKVYICPKGTLCIPVVNLYSCLAAEKTKSVAKRFYGKKWSDVATPIMTYVQMGPMHMPLKETVDGPPLTWDDCIESGKILIEEHVARLDKGIPNPKVRPSLQLPWCLEVELSIIQGMNSISGEKMHQYLIEAGLIGLGTFRPIFGQFNVESFTEV